MLLSISNNTEVKQQISRNGLYFWLGVAALGASILILVLFSGSADYGLWVVYITYALLILGLILSKRGAFNRRRHGIGYKIKSESDMLADELDNLPPRYHLFNWIKLGNLKIEHLLVTPSGLMIIDAKSQAGNVSAEHDRYRRRQGFTGWFTTLGEPGIGQPSIQLTKQVKELRAWFETHDYELPVDGVVVLMNINSKLLKAEEMSFPVCLLSDLKQVIRGWETELKMSAAEQQEIEDLIIKSLPAGEAEEARTLIQTPGYKRASVVNAQRSIPAAKAVKEKASKVEEVAPKPRLTPEERERLRLERIRAAEEKGRTPVNPYAPPEPGKQVGLNGKMRTVTPVVEKKAPKRRAAPLRKPPPGAFGDYTASGDKKK